MSLDTEKEEGGSAPTPHPPPTISGLGARPADQERHSGALHTPTVESKRIRRRWKGSGRVFGNGIIGTINARIAAAPISSDGGTNFSQVSSD